MNTRTNRQIATVARNAIRAAGLFARVKCSRYETITITTGTIASVRRVVEAATAGMCSKGTITYEVDPMIERCNSAAMHDAVEAAKALASANVMPIPVDGCDGYSIRSGAFEGTFDLLGPVGLLTSGFPGVGMADLLARARIRSA
jgi:hypothetical protein